MRSFEKIKVLIFNLDQIFNEWTALLSKTTAESYSSLKILQQPQTPFLHLTFCVTRYQQRKYIHYSPWVLTSRERSQSGTVQSRKVLEMFFKEWVGREMGINVHSFFLSFFSFVFRNLGPPLSSFVSTVSIAAPCSMAPRGATHHDNTDSPTTQNTCLLPHNHIPA